MRASQFTVRNTVSERPTGSLIRLARFDGKARTGAENKLFNIIYLLKSGRLQDLSDTKGPDARPALIFRQQSVQLETESSSISA